MADDKVTVYFKCKVCKKTRDMLVPPEREQLWLDRIENGQEIICYACPEPSTFNYPEKKGIEGYYKWHGGYDWNNKEA